MKLGRLRLAVLSTFALVAGTGQVLSACGGSQGGVSDPFERFVKAAADGCGFEGQPPCELEEVVVESDPPDDPPPDDPPDDPCEANPSSPGCSEYDFCSEFPEYCPQDPCEYDPSQCGGGGGDDPPPQQENQDPPKPPCKETAYPLIENAAVQQAFKDLWAQSKFAVNGTIQAQADRRETFGWIVQQPNGQYAFQAEPNLVSSACGLDPAPGKTVTKPANAVAFVHTHPFKFGETTQTCEDSPRMYTPGPSPEDREMANLWGIPGYILDGSFVTHFKGTGDVVSNSVQRCGY